jgi:hypothetical protein
MERPCSATTSLRTSGNGSVLLPLPFGLKTSRG